MATYHELLGEPLGCYVYTWANGPDDVFYVGRGRGSRALGPHMGSDGRPTAAEEFRQLIGGLCQVAIVREGMTSRQASALEGEMIRQLRPAFNEAGVSPVRPVAGVPGSLDIGKATCQKCGQRFALTRRGQSRCETCRY